MNANNTELRRQLSLCLSGQPYNINYENFEEAHIDEIIDAEMSLTYYDSPIVNEDGYIPVFAIYAEIAENTRKTCLNLYGLWIYFLLTHYPEIDCYKMVQTRYLNLDMSGYNGERL